jgi:hypothetical protein
MFMTMKKLRQTVRAFRQGKLYYNGILVKQFYFNGRKAKHGKEG